MTGDDVTCSNPAKESQPLLHGQSQKAHSDTAQCMGSGPSEEEDALEWLDEDL